MDVSRSGRIRKKSSKLADFESPDDIDANKTPRSGSASKPRTPASALTSSIKDYPLIVDDPDSPDDLDDLQEADEIREDEFDNIPDVQVADDDLDEIDVESTDNLKNDVESLTIQGHLDDDEEGNLMIDDSRGSKAKAKSVASSIYFSEKKNTKRQGGSGSKAKKSKAKGKIRPKYTAYMLWAKANRNKVLEQNPGLDFSGISKKLGDIWSKSVPMSEKWSWKRKASQLAVKTARQQRMAAMAQDQKKVEKTDEPAAFKVNGTEPLDCAAHLKLLGDSLSIIGAKLTEHEGQIAVSGSLSVLLDSLLCSIAPLLCLTQQVPELNGISQEKLTNMLDNIAYIMPGP